MERRRFHSPKPPIHLGTAGLSLYLSTIVFVGILMLSLVMFAETSSAGDPAHVNVADGSANCFSYDSPYIGFADCQTTLTGGVGALAVTYPSCDRVEWNTNYTGGSFNHTVTSESSEFAGVPGTCGTGHNFDWQPTFNGDSFIVEFEFSTPGSCYYYCKIHGPSQMRGVVLVGSLGSTTTTSTTTTTIFGQTTTTTTTPPNQPPTAVSLTPVNIATAPSVAQSFTAVYSDPNGYQNIADTSLLLSGSTHNELVHFSPTTNKFTMMGVGGDCSPGQATTLSDGNLTLNCSTSSVSGSGSMWTVTYNLTPLPPLSGTAYVLVIAVTDQGSLSNNKAAGTWTVNRSPGANSLMPMDNMGETGMGQMFTAVYSDPDGWQNIAAANFYLSGNGGMHNEWLHYLGAPNLFTMLGTNDICYPGQMKMLSNGYLTLDCSSSSISGSGTMLTVIFQVTPQMSSSGIMYEIFTAVSDQAGAANGILAGTWMIQ